MMVKEVINKRTRWMRSGGDKKRSNCENSCEPSGGPKQHNPISFSKAADEGIDATALLGALNPGQISIF
jgi:hypothetical protein